MNNNMNALTQEILLKGIAAAPGIAIGTAYLYSKHIPHVQMREISVADVENEIRLVCRAETRSAECKNI
jgi:phosphoenolpyruvate-protein kinase (PTS system EI component)